MHFTCKATRELGKIGGEATGVQQKEAIQSLEDAVQSRLKGYFEAALSSDPSVSASGRLATNGLAGLRLSKDAIVAHKIAFDKINALSIGHGTIPQRIKTLRQAAEVISPKGKLWKFIHQDRGDALLLERDPSRLDSIAFTLAEFFDSAVTNHFAYRAANIMLDSAIGNEELSRLEQYWSTHNESTEQMPDSLPHFWGFLPYTLHKLRKQAPHGTPWATVQPFFVRTSTINMELTFGRSEPTLKTWTSRHDVRMFMAEQIRAIGCAQAEMTETQDGSWLATEVRDAITDHLADLHTKRAAYEAAERVAVSTLGTLGITAEQISHAEDTALDILARLEMDKSHFSSNDLEEFKKSQAQAHELRVATDRTDASAVYRYVYAKRLAELRLLKATFDDAITKMEELIELAEKSGKFDLAEFRNQFSTDLFHMPAPTIPTADYSGSIDLASGRTLLVVEMPQKGPGGDWVDLRRQYAGVYVQHCQGAGCPLRANLAYKKEPEPNPSEADSVGSWLFEYGSQYIFSDSKKEIMDAIAHQTKPSGPIVTSLASVYVDDDANVWVRSPGNQAIEGVRIRRIDGLTNQRESWGIHNATGGDTAHHADLYNAFLEHTAAWLYMNAYREYMMRVAQKFGEVAQDLSRFLGQASMVEMMPTQITELCSGKKQKEVPQPAETASSPPSDILCFCNGEDGYEGLYKNQAAGARKCSNERTISSGSIAGIMESELDWCRKLECGPNNGLMWLKKVTGGGVSSIKLTTASALKTAYMLFPGVADAVPEAVLDLMFSR
jgi:hypothetical protein